MPQFLPLRMRHLFDPTNLIARNDDQPYRPMDENPRPSLPEPTNPIRRGVMNYDSNEQDDSDLKYTPENQAGERLNELISQFPKRENPSFMRRIGASMAGISEGSEAGRKFLNAPHDEQVEDWKTQITPTISAASDERNRNINERVITSQARISRRLESGEAAKERMSNERLHLDQLKNQQIFETKLADMQRQSDAASQRLQLAYDQLQSNQSDAAAQLRFHQAQLAAEVTQHKLENIQRDVKESNVETMNNERIKQMHKAMEDNGLEISEVTLPDGTKESKVTRRGSSTIRVIAPDGTHGNWPANQPLAKDYIKIQ